VSRGRRRTAIVGNRAPAKIGGLLGAGELEQRSGKLIRGSVRAVGGRPWLPTMSRSRRSGRRRGGSGNRSWGSGIGRRTRRTECRSFGSAIAREGIRPWRAAVSPPRRGEVAAEQSSQQPWRAQMGTAGRGKRSGAGRGRRVGGRGAGGGRRRPAQRRPGKLHRR
jgi:hypothetical protein